MRTLNTKYICVVWKRALNIIQVHVLHTAWRARVHGDRICWQQSNHVVGNGRENTSGNLSKFIKSWHLSGAYTIYMADAACVVNIIPAEALAANQPPPGHLQVWYWPVIPTPRRSMATTAATVSGQYPCKHAGTCQYRTCTGPMLSASDQYMPGTGNQRHVYRVAGGIATVSMKTHGDIITN